MKYSTDTTLKELLDGNLFTYLRMLGPVQLVAKNYTIFSSELYRRMGEVEKYILKKLFIGRKLGLNWLWCPEDLEKSEWTRKEKVEWRLAAAELDMFLPDDKTCKDMPDIWKSNGFDDSGIIWDTESSAIYPCFKTKKAGIQFIKDFNKWADTAVGIHHLDDRFPLLTSYGNQ